jgi:hypothetical protein|uniref:Secreted protein n=1 Tax=Prymnesium polylepis TaxID=72548 RepID=A0A7S4HD80_9EUKA
MNTRGCAVVILTVLHPTHLTSLHLDREDRNEASSPPTAWDEEPPRNGRELPAGPMALSSRKPEAECCASPASSACACSHRASLYRLTSASRAPGWIRYVRPTSLWLLQGCRSASLSDLNWWPELTSSLRRGVERHGARNVHLGHARSRRDLDTACSAARVCTGRGWTECNHALDRPATRDEIKLVWI